MGKPEAKIENYLRRRVKEEGGRIRKLKWIGRRGAADNLVWFSGKCPETDLLRPARAALVECKAEGEFVDWQSPQGREFTLMQGDGWMIFQVNSREQVDWVLRRVRGVE